MTSNPIRRVRQNHGLEHATVAVLLERGVRPPLGGYSTAGGFFIFGRASSETVSDAAYEALARMKEGQKELAVSPYCGTNLATGALLAGLLTTAILGRRKGRLKRFPFAIAAIVGATLASRPLGNSLQRKYTTLAEVSDIEISRVRRLWKGSYTVHRISTTLSTR